MNIEEYNYYFGNLRTLNFDYMLDGNKKVNFVQKNVYKYSWKGKRFNRNQRIAFIKSEKIRNKTERYNKKLEEGTNRYEYRQIYKTERLGKFGKGLVGCVIVFAALGIMYLAVTNSVDLEVAFKFITGK